MTRARHLLASMAVVALATTACGATDATETDAAAPPAAGACLAGAEDCQDTGGDMGAPPPDSLPVADPDQPVGDAAGDGEDPAQAAQVEPVEGLENIHPVDWEEVRVDPADPSRVTVVWWSGVAPCNALSEVRVETSDEAVTLTVLEGNVPSEEEQACIEMAVRKSATVTLDEEIGPRSILDGAE